MKASQLIQVVAQKSQLSQKEAAQVVKLFGETAQNALAASERVSLSGFGTFYWFQTKSRTIPNPKNPRQRILTLGRRVVKFKPAPPLKEVVKDLVLPPSFEERLLQLRTKPLRIPYISLKNRKIPKEILMKIPERIARAYQILPVEEKEGKLVVAMVNPEDLEAVEFVKKKVGMPLMIGITTSSELNSAFDQYGGLAQEMEKVLKEVESKGEKKAEKAEVKAVAPKEEFDLETPTSRLITSLLKKAVKERASDIHIEPQEEGVQVRFRIDGVLQKIVSLPKEIHPSVVARIKILSNLKIDETRMPQDGRFTMLSGNNEIDFRVSTMPTVYGEKVVIRILDKSKGLLSLEELGLRGKAFEVVDENVHKAHGMVLITGPTGSGKTTTLYAVLSKIYHIGINIVTLEDPVEYHLKGINQSQVNPAVNYTFSSGLRSILRQDPDVIMLGEIRDPETASMAVHAALTGHLVFSTLHTNDAAGAIPRLIDMGVEPFLLNSSLNAVIAQRLCRKICENCKEERPVPSEILQAVRNEMKLKKAVFYKGRGCPICNQTGYKGRIGIFEVLGVSEAIKKLIGQRASADAIQKQAIKEGMLTLKQDGILKALDGITTIEEVWRVTKE